MNEMACISAIGYLPECCHLPITCVRAPKMCSFPSSSLSLSSWWHRMQIVTPRPLLRRPLRATKDAFGSYEYHAMISDPYSFCMVVCSLGEDETESLACGPPFDRRKVVIFFAGMSTYFDGPALAAQFADMPALRGKDYGKRKMRYPDYTETRSGLQFKDLRVGNGPKLKMGETVVISFRLIGMVTQLDITAAYLKLATRQRVAHSWGVIRTSANSKLDLKKRANKLYLSCQNTLRSYLHLRKLFWEWLLVVSEEWLAILYRLELMELVARNWN